ncbi:MAG: histidine phosphatase family protein [Candidatus Omnitrophica bacterium]|nr:histidine phosphatase family protein [Candidatus Omnitrophota bacterium]
MPKKVILVRHGRTRWNAERRYMGVTDIDLDDTGLAQAEKLKKRLSLEEIDKVYASDSCRALNFASIIFDRKPIVKMRELREMNFGVLEGMTYEEILRKYPKVYDEWLSDIHSANIPEGESMQSMKERVLGAFNKITSANRGKILAIVTHAGPIRVIVNDITRSVNFWDVMPDSASVSVIEFADKMPKVVLINDTSHL